jgi:hypothetical protein
VYDLVASWLSEANDQLQTASCLMVVGLMWLRQCQRFTCPASSAWCCPITAIVRASLKRYHCHLLKRHLTPKGGPNEKSLYVSGISTLSAKNAKLGLLRKSTDTGGYQRAITDGSSHEVLGPWHLAILRYGAGRSRLEPTPHDPRGGGIQVRTLIPAVRDQLADALAGLRRSDDEAR